MRRSPLRGYSMLFNLVAILASSVLWNGSVSAQEVIIVKSLEEAEKAVEEARDAQADVYAPEDYQLALYYLSQAQDEAVAYRQGKDQKDTHLFSARKSGEAVNLLAERAKYQAKVATTKAIEVKVDRQITAIKAQIVESFNITGASRSFTPEREDLLTDLSAKEAERKEARRVRQQAESELRKLTLEGETKPPPR